MELSQMTKDERSLLLYFETQSVDHTGKVDPRRMDIHDTAIAKRWNESGFVRFGRLASECITRGFGNYFNYWCELSEEAWELAHEERRARHKRMYEKRTWYSTQEKRDHER